MGHNFLPLVLQRLELENVPDLNYHPSQNKLFWDYVIFALLLHQSKLSMHTAIICSTLIEEQMGLKEKAMFILT